MVPVLISLVLLFALGDRRDRGVPGIRVFLDDQGHPSPPSLAREGLDSLSPPLGPGAPEMILRNKKQTFIPRDLRDDPTDKIQTFISRSPGDHLADKKQTFIPRGRRDDPKDKI